VQVYVVTTEEDGFYGNIDERIPVKVIYGIYFDKDYAEKIAKDQGGDVEEHTAI
jgi:hypothetical protein